MAARSVHCFFDNQTDYDLTKTSQDSESHTSGQFTDPWYPPPAIPAHHHGEWRSESDGVATGAIGSVSYSFLVPVVNKDPTKPDATTKKNVLISWSDPYVGVNSCDCAVTDDFTNAASGDVFQGHLIQSGAIRSDAYASKIILDVLAPMIGFANEGGVNDTNALFAIRMNAVPTQPTFDFAALPPNVLTPIPTPPNDAWDGTWHGTVPNGLAPAIVVDVTPALGSPGSHSVVVREDLFHPPITLSAAGVVPADGTITSYVQDHWSFPQAAAVKSSPQAHAPLAASVQGAQALGLNQKVMPAHIAAGGSATQIAVRAGFSQLVPDPHIVLTLYVEIGVGRTYRLRYQRSGNGGTIVEDVMLSKYVALR